MPKVIIAVLDWGLGHASRCIPLIRQLQQEGHQVLAASSGPALDLLKAECPDLPTHSLPAYRVRYPNPRMWWNILRQGPRIAWVIRQEQRAFRQLIRQEQPDFLISDGRFGAYHPEVRSIWLAHQLHIQYPQQWIADTLNFFYHRYIRVHFTEVWVPDQEEPNKLAGKLSNPIPQLPHRYLGALSRFRSLPSPSSFTYDWLALLSGPEPQRSRLEQRLRQQLAGRKALIVRGVPGRTTIQQLDAHLSVVDWLHGAQLAQQVQQAQRIVCRSGYSSLMDLQRWQKVALLIPTPGQTEQLYLAQYWQARGWALWQSQDQMNLGTAEQQLDEWPLIPNFFPKN